MPCTGACGGVSDACIILNLRIGFSGDMGRNGLPIIRDPEMLPPGVQYELV